MAIEPGTSEWARFQDWLRGEAGIKTDWTIVANAEPHGEAWEKPFVQNSGTLSYLVKNDLTAINEAFAKETWDLNYNSAEIEICTTDKGPHARERLGNNVGRPFLALKDAVGKYKDEWDILPALPSYFNLRVDDIGNYVDPYTSDIVVYIPYPAKSGPLKIRTDYLQDYLSARNMVLIRQHDILRYWKNYIEGLPEYEEGVLIRESWGLHYCYLKNSLKNIHQRFSRILAKDIVLPATNSGKVGGRWAGVKKDDTLPEFIVDVDIHGNEKKMKPQWDDLGPPVFFDPRVLKRYYDEPSRYSVGFHSPGMGGVGFLDRWSLAIGRNDEGLICLWLGDLVKQRLSLDEIQHWAAYNVYPRGKVAGDFYNSQMMCKPSSIPSLETRLIETRAALQKALKDRGMKPFIDYEGPDEYVEKLLRIPLYDDHVEFQDTILILARIFNDTLDCAQYERTLKSEEATEKDGKKLGPIIMFSKWLRLTIGISQSSTESLAKSLHNIQAVRSKMGAAHRFADSAYQEVLSKLGLEGKGITASGLFITVAEPLASSLENICVEIGIKDKLWWMK